MQEGRSAKQQQLGFVRNEGGKQSYPRLTYQSLYIIYVKDTSFFGWRGLWLDVVSAGKGQGLMLMQLLPTHLLRTRTNS